MQKLNYLIVLRAHFLDLENTGVRIEGWLLTTRLEFDSRREVSDQFKTQRSKKKVA